MKSLKWVAPALLVVTTFAVTAEAMEGARVWQVQNRLRFEYDDNIYQTDGDEESSGKIIEEAEFHLNFNLSRTFVALRYRPTFVYWEDREDDDTDFHHDAEFVLNHRASPRLSYGLKNTFRLQEQPAVVHRKTALGFLTSVARDAVLLQDGNHIVREIQPLLTINFARKQKQNEEDDRSAEITDREHYGRLKGMKIYEWRAG